MKKIILILSIILMSLSFSYNSFSVNNVNASQKYYYTKKHSREPGFWQKFWDAIKDVQE